MLYAFRKVFVMNRFIVVSLLSIAAIGAHAAELSSLARTEIDSLLHSLGNSKCQFYRNGSWHSGSETRAHLTKKYHYLLDKGLISSAEEFISAAATESSMTGEAYKVKCPTQEALPSSVWLKNELHRVRAHGVK
jgi:hypothetical protein